MFIDFTSYDCNNHAREGFCPGTIADPFEYQAVTGDYRDFCWSRWRSHIQKTGFLIQKLELRHHSPQWVLGTDTARDSVLLFVKGETWNVERAGRRPAAEAPPTPPELSPELRWKCRGALSAPTRQS